MVLYDGLEPSLPDLGGLAPIQSGKALVFIILFNERVAEHFYLVLTLLFSPPPRAILTTIMMIRYNPPEFQAQASHQDIYHHDNPPRRHHRFQRQWPSLELETQQAAQTRYKGLMGDGNEPVNQS